MALEFWDFGLLQCRQDEHISFDMLVVGIRFLVSREVQIHLRALNRQQ